MNAVEKIGIFKGREKTYNKLILKSLFISHGPLKGWELAKRIYEQMRETGTLPRNWQGLNWYAITQKIYSVLIRKNGRLQDLCKKEYIVKIEQNGSDVWHITSKGSIATLILDKSFLDIVNEAAGSADSNAIIRNFEEQLRKASPKLSYFGLKMEIDSDIAQHSFGSFFKEFTSRAGLLRIASKVENAVENGLDLDTMKECDLIIFLALSDSVLDFIEKQFKKQKVSSHE